MGLYTCLDVATAHITSRDIDILQELTELDSDDYDTSRVSDTQYGFVIHLGDDDHIAAEIQDAKDRGLSDNYQRILRKAFDEGAYMINIDVAGDTLDDIPIADD